MAKMTFQNEADFEAAVADRVNAALAEVKAAHEKEISALNDMLTKAREANATADYSAYAEFPDLIELMKKTDLRPGALPALCALQVWKGKTTAAEIAKEIPTTPKLGEKGGGASSPKVITAALQKLQKALIAANTGLGVRVSSVRGKDGDSTVKKFRFQPMVELKEDDDGETQETGAEQPAAEQPAAEQPAGEQAAA